MVIKSIVLGYSDYHTLSIMLMSAVLYLPKLAESFSFIFANSQLYAELLGHSWWTRFTVYSNELNGQSTFKCCTLSLLL